MLPDSNMFNNHHYATLCAISMQRSSKDLQYYVDKIAMDLRWLEKCAENRYALFDSIICKFQRLIKLFKKSYDLPLIQ